MSRRAAVVSGGVRRAAVVSVGARRVESAAGRAGRGTVKVVRPCVDLTPVSPTTFTVVIAYRAPGSSGAAKRTTRVSLGAGRRASIFVARLESCRAAGSVSCRGSAPSGGGRTGGRAAAAPGCGAAAARWEVSRAAAAARAALSLAACAAASGGRFDLGDAVVRGAS